MKSHGFGKYVSYNKSFENSIMQMAIDSSETSKDAIDVLTTIRRNTIDLMDFFKNKSYYSSDFDGSYSIKVVAPHFAKGKIDYSELKNVQKGDQSSLNCKR
jgi:hypothetical protein